VTTDQLIRLIKRHANLAFKEGTFPHGSKKRTEYGMRRIRALAKIIREIEPYDE